MAAVRKGMVQGPGEVRMPADGSRAINHRNTPRGTGMTPLEAISRPQGAAIGPGGWELLLVESQEESARSLLRGLSDQGYSLKHLRDGLSALVALREPPWPAAILVASDLPDVSGFDVCRSLRGFGYRGHLLLLVQSGQSGLLVAGLDAGADDVVAIPAGADELSARLRAKNRRCLECGPGQSPGSARGSVDESDEPALGARAAEGKNPLTPREQEVLEQMVLGLGNNEIAERLFLSLETVKTHVRNLMGKLKARHRTQAVIVALQSGYCLLPGTGHGPSMRPNRVGC